MAIEYQFEIETHLTPEQVITNLLKISGESEQINRLNYDVLYVNRPEQTIYSKRVPDGEALSQRESIKPDIRLTFRVKLSIQDPNKTEEVLLSLVLGWLNENEGNAAFLYNGETVVLMRRLGDLIINSNTDFWNPNTLEILPKPYKMQDIPIL